MSFETNSKQELYRDPMASLSAEFFFLFVFKLLRRLPFIRIGIVSAKNREPVGGEYPNSATSDRRRGRPRRTVFVECLSEALIVPIFVDAGANGDGGEGEGLHDGLRREGAVLEPRVLQPRRGNEGRCRLVEHRAPLLLLVHRLIETAGDPQFAA
ncbi:hypothetical protein BHE74_00057558 [Ensete ventricosum]|nr:hypothetical protein BHE74_00057558 [Ensete ventricosum]